MRNTTIQIILSLIFITGSFSLFSQSVIISEFMAVNNSTLSDEDGNFSDWIELHNSGTSDVNIGGWFITDDKAFPKKCVLPEMTIPADSFLIIWASGKDKYSVGNEMHTNFKLTGIGEYLGLIKPDGLEISSEYSPSFPEQYSDISYGILNGSGSYFSNPTPGQANVGSLFLAPPVFSVKHGYYYETFSLELLKSSNDIDIYYTTDASTPNNTNGTLYTGPISITTSTIVRAVSYNTANGLGTTVTSSYIFPEHVKDQDNDQPGYPETWLTPIHGTDDYDRITANYDMKPKALANSEISNVLVKSLESLPVVSVVTDIDNLFSESIDSLTGGIYTYNGEPDGPTRDLNYHLGRGWIRPASVEYFNSDEADKNIDLQANCALKIHGGATRTRAKTEKHSFKLGFKSAYGPSKLDEKIFGKGSPKQYDWLVLRGGFAPRLGLQVKDPWAKQTVRDMGQYAAYNKFVHVFINGLYWGMYNLSERMDENCMRDNIGGSSSDYDIVKDYYEVECGDASEWDRLISLAQTDIDDDENYQYLIGNSEDGTPNISYNKLLNDENLIDYILMNLYSGMGDWDHHNWAAARRKTDSEGFHFLAWDCEGVFKDEAVSNLVGRNKNRPSGLFEDLLENEQFRNKVISHINKHFFEEGALTPEPCLSRYENILGTIDTALIADQARWVCDMNDIWNEKYHNFIYDYFPKRTDAVFNQLISNDLYPTIDFPRFSTTNNTLPDTMDVFISTTTSGKILYSLDGTDPGHYKLGHPSIFEYDNNPLPLVVGINTVKARVKQDSLWSRLMKYTYKVTSTSGTSASDIIANEPNINLYPNPIKNDINIAFELNEPSEISIKVYNVIGREVGYITDQYWNEGDHTLSWNAESLSAGMYICVFENRTKAIVSKVKLVKE